MRCDTKASHPIMRPDEFFEKSLQRVATLLGRRSLVKQTGGDLERVVQPDLFTWLR
jgi:hypothetical protein